MKRKTVILIICITISFFIFVYLCFFNTFYITGLEVDSRNLNNNYNNEISNGNSELVKLHDKIYFNLYNNGGATKYGTYEISSNITKRVHWNGLSLYPENISLSCIYQDKILKPEAYSDDYFYDEEGLNEFRENEEYICGDITVDYWNVSNNQYEKCINILNPNKIKIEKNFMVKDNVLYFFSIDNSIYVCKDNKLEKFIDYSVLNNGFFPLKSNCFISADSVYYPNYINDKICICKYNTVNKKVSNYCEIDELENTDNQIYGLFANLNDVFLLVVMLIIFIMQIWKLEIQNCFLKLTVF